ncbi:hypothetical protein P7C70_g4855, partial [Phenoliferia sp. Uapishka_3]
MQPRPGKSKYGKLACYFIPLPLPSNFSSEAAKLTITYLSPVEASLKEALSLSVIDAKPSPILPTLCVGDETRPLAHLHHNGRIERAVLTTDNSKTSGDVAPSLYGNVALLLFLAGPGSRAVPIDKSNYAYDKLGEDLTIAGEIVPYCRFYVAGYGEIKVRLMYLDPENYCNTFLGKMMYPPLPAAPVNLVMNMPLAQYLKAGAIKIAEAARALCYEHRFQRYTYPLNQDGSFGAPGLPYGPVSGPFTRRQDEGAFLHFTSPPRPLSYFCYEAVATDPRPKRPSLETSPEGEARSSKPFGFVKYGSGDPVKLSTSNLQRAGIGAPASSPISWGGMRDPSPTLTSSSVNDPYSSSFGLGITLGSMALDGEVSPPSDRALYEQAPIGTHSSAGLEHARSEPRADFGSRLAPRRKHTIDALAELVKEADASTRGHTAATWGSGSPQVKAPTAPFSATMPPVSSPASVLVSTLDDMLRAKYANEWTTKQTQKPLASILKKPKSDLRPQASEFKAANHRWESKGYTAPIAAFGQTFESSWAKPEPRSTEVSSDLFNAGIETLTSFRSQRDWRRKATLDADSGRYVSFKGKVSFFHPLSFYPEPETSLPCPPIQETPRSPLVVEAMSGGDEDFKSLLARWTTVNSAEDSSSMDTSSSVEQLSVSSKHEKTLTRERRQARRATSLLKAKEARAAKQKESVHSISKESNWANLQQQNLGFRTRGDKRRAACEGLI